MMRSFPNSLGRPGAALRARANRFVPAVLVALLGLFLTCGCTVRNSRTISGSGSFASNPGGPTAVLRVTAERRSDPRTGQTTWGLINTPNVEARFGEFLASEASRDGGLTVIDPLDVEQRLLAARLEPTLQPDDQQLQQFARVLGLSSYLTAHVVRSRLEYRLFWSWSDVEYTVACYQPGRAEALWQAHVCRAAPGKTDRQTTALSLKEMFEWLKGRDLPPAAAECPE
jgi:hypothetical protein